MSRLLLIVNTNATRHSPRRQREVQQLLGSQHKLEVATTGHRGHATDLAREAAEEGIETVVVLGGDGTINEALNGLVQTDTKLGLLPGGNTNVLARTLGISRRLDLAAIQLLRGLSLNRSRPLGLGSLNGRWFAFCAGIGFDADVVASVEERVRMKHMYGDWFFAACAVNTFFRGYDRLHPALTLRTPERTTDRAFFALVFNSNPYTYIKGRPISPSPGATFERGLWLTAPLTMKTTKILGLLVSALRDARRFVDGPDVAVLEDLLTFEITSERAMSYQVDGDYLGKLTHANFAWEPNLLQVVC